MPAAILALVALVKILLKRFNNAALVAAMVAGITYMFKTKLGLFVMGALIWLGINFATIKIVIEPAIDLLRQYADGGNVSSVGQFGVTAVAWLGVLNLDKAITMIISAIVARHAANMGRLIFVKAPVGAAA